MHGDARGHRDRPRRSVTTASPSRAGCSWRSWASGSTATTSPPPRWRAAPSRCSAPARPRSRRSSSTTSWPRSQRLARARRRRTASRPYRARAHRAPRARPAPRTYLGQRARRRRTDGGDARATSTTSSASRSPCCAATSRDRVPRRSRWAPAASATSPSCAGSRRPTSPPCSTSAPPTSASSAPARRSPQAKGELVEALAPSGTAVLNADDDLVAAMRDRTPGHGAHLRATRRRRALARRRPRRPRPAVVRAGPRRRVARRLAQPARRPPGRQRHRGRRHGASPSASTWRTSPRRPRPRRRPPRAGGWSCTSAPTDWSCVNDAYNANPASMARRARRARRDRWPPRRAYGRRARRDARARRGHRRRPRGRRPVRRRARRRRRRHRRRRARRRSGAAPPGVPGWTGVTILTAGRDEASTWVRENAAAGDVRPREGVAGCALETVAEGAAARRRRGGREPMRAILLGGGLALLISLLGTRVAITWFTRLGLRPGDPRRRPDQPPHQARHAHDGWGRHHPLGRGRLLRGQAHHPERAVGLGAAAALPLRRAGRRRLPRRLHQDRQAAQPRPAQQGQDDRPDRGRAGLRLPRRLARARGRPGQHPGVHAHLVHP